MAVQKITIVDCVATATTITVFFSSDVIALDPTQKTPQDMLYLKNYSIKTGAKTVTLLSAQGVLYVTPSYDPTLRAVTLTMTGSPPSTSNLPLVSGAPLSVTAKPIYYLDKKGNTGEYNAAVPFPTTVRGDALKSPTVTAAKTAEDAVSYPLLTEEVGYPPSPLAAPSSGAGGGAGGGAGVALGQAAVKAVGDVLGWKVKSDDPKGFIGALTQSFSLTEVEGHVEAKWTPRTYAVQSDLSGGLTGAQASIYNRAKEALDQSLPLLGGLYALRPEAIPEDVEALKDIARSQMTALVQELGVPGAPRIVRINQYFLLLLGQDMNQIIAATATPGGKRPNAPFAYLVTEPDSIPPSSDTVWGTGKAGTAKPPAWFTPASTLGTLRDELGLWSVYPGTIQGVVEQILINTIEDEQNVTNYRLLVDYLTSLALSWINNQQFFPFAQSANPTPFFGTQLVLLSRQLLSVSEDVDDIRFAMDSVFLGPSERQTLQVNFGGGTVMFFEDFASWVQTFATAEGPQLIQSGGKFGVQNSFLPVVQNFQIMANAAVDPNPANAALPRGFHTARVQRALQQLSDDLQQLITLASQVKFALPVTD